MGIANALMLDILIMVGLGYAVWDLFRSNDFKLVPLNIGRLLSKPFFKHVFPSVALIITVFIFTAITQAPPRGFNFHDDFEKYMTYPIRMLATGSLGGGFFNALGTETLGGQAFLHGFAAAHWPIGYVNTVDAVFALVLCLMIILFVALYVKLPYWLIPLVVAAPVFINPQYVNISTSYIASALILFLFLGPWAVRERNYPFLAWPHGACIALVYSALIALKTIFILVVVIHFLFLAVCFIYTSRPLKAVLTWIAAVSIFSLIFISPWLLLYLPQWLDISIPNIEDVSLLDSSYKYLITIPDLFSLDLLFYGFGSTFAHYTFTIIFVSLCGLLLVIDGFSRQWTDKTKTSFVFAAFMTPPIIYFLSIIFGGPILYGRDAMLRYVIPIIIAAVPTSMIIAGSVLSASGLPKKIESQRSKPALLILALLSITLLGSFYGSFTERIKQAFQYGSILSFSDLARHPLFLDYNQFVLSAEASEKVLRAQQIVPKGEPLVAWTPLAIHLDYQRNRILDVNPSGLAAPWVDFPFVKGSDTGITFFEQLEVRFLLWQYSGPFVRSEEYLKEWTQSPFFHYRTVGLRTLEFVKMLSDIVEHSQILYDDGTIMVIRLHD